MYPAPPHVWLPSLVQLLCNIIQCPMTSSMCPVLLHYLSFLWLLARVYLFFAVYQSPVTSSMCRTPLHFLPVSWVFQHVSSSSSITSCKSPVPLHCLSVSCDFQNMSSPYSLSINLLWRPAHVQFIFTVYLSPVTYSTCPVSLHCLTSVYSVIIVCCFSSSSSLSNCPLWLAKRAQLLSISLILLLLPARVYILFTVYQSSTTSSPVPYLLIAGLMYYNVCIS